MSKKITTIGGQALMEGIMMVGPQRTVAAFCDGEGALSTEEISLPSLVDFSRSCHTSGFSCSAFSSARAWLMAVIPSSGSVSLGRVSVGISM